MYKTTCSWCGKPIYQNKYGEWKHKPYSGTYPHKARPQEGNNQ